MSVKKLFVANCVFILAVVCSGIYMVDQLSYVICRQRFLRQPTSSEVQLQEVRTSGERQTVTGHAVQQDERTKYDKLGDGWVVDPRPQKFKADQELSRTNTTQNDMEPLHGRSNVDDKRTKIIFLERQKSVSRNKKTKVKGSQYNVALSMNSRYFTTEITPGRTKWSATISPIPLGYGGTIFKRPKTMSQISRNEPSVVTEAKETSVIDKPVSDSRRLSNTANEELKALRPTRRKIREKIFPTTKFDSTRKLTRLETTTESAVAVKKPRNVLLKSSMEFRATATNKFTTMFTTHEKIAAKLVPTAASVFTRKQENKSPTVARKTSLAVTKRNIRVTSAEKRAKTLMKEVSMQQGGTKSTNAMSWGKRENTTYTEQPVTTTPAKTKIPIIASFLSKKERLTEFYLANPLKNKSARCDRSNILLTIIVASGLRGWGRRTSIRRSWASTNYSKAMPKFNSTDLSQLGRKDLVKVVFLLGKSDNSILQRKVEKEAQSHRDIVFGEFYDNYRNLTRKTRMGLRWVRNFCTSAKYVLKTDDDVFVNIYKLVEWLDTRPRNKFYTGWCNTGSPAVRDRRSKW